MRMRVINTSLPASGYSKAEKIRSRWCVWKETVGSRGLIVRYPESTKLSRKNLEPDNQVFELVRLEGEEEQEWIIVQEQLRDRGAALP